MATVGESHSCMRSNQDDVKTDLFSAARSGDIPVVRRLVENAPALVNAEWSEWDCSSPLDAAVVGGQREVIRFLIAHGANVNAMDTLNLAVMSGNLEIMQMLLEAGANVDCRTMGEGQTPLHLAVQQDNVDAVVLLLAHGANPNATDWNGHTPLHDAVALNRTTIANRLISAGADAQPSGES